MLNNVLHAWILSNTPHADTVGVIAPHILHEHVGGVWFGSKAVVANINPGVGDAEAIHIERIEAIGVLGLGLGLSVSSQFSTLE